jgi:hypothetical protein
MNGHYQNRRNQKPPGFYALKPGTVIKVKHCAYSYPLPAGLNYGDSATVLSFDSGYYKVDSGGRTFKIFSTNVAD